MGSEGFELRGSLGKSFLGILVIWEEVAECTLAVYRFGFIWPALDLMDVSGAGYPFSFLRNGNIDWVVDSFGCLSLLPEIMLFFILNP